MDRIYNITNDFCLFNGDILDFEAPIDETKISKVNPYDNNYVQPCNEYKIGLKLEKVLRTAKNEPVLDLDIKLSISSIASLLISLGITH